MGINCLLWIRDCLDALLRRKILIRSMGPGRPLGNLPCSIILKGPPLLLPRRTVSFILWAEWRSISLWGKTLSKRRKYARRYWVVSTFFIIWIVMKKAKYMKRFNRRKSLQTNTSSSKGSLETVFISLPKECSSLRRWRINKSSPSIILKKEIILVSWLSSRTSLDRRVLRLLPKLGYCTLKEALLKGC